MVVEPQTYSTLSWIQSTMATTRSVRVGDLARRGPRRDAPGGPTGSSGWEQVRDRVPVHLRHRLVVDLPRREELGSRTRLWPGTGPRAVCGGRSPAGENGCRSRRRWNSSTFTRGSIVNSLFEDRLRGVPLRVQGFRIKVEGNLTVYSSVAEQ